MNDIKQSRRFGTLDHKVVLQFETDIGRELPGDYRDFLLEHDGGIPSLTKIILEEDPSIPEIDAEWTEVMHFYSLHPNATDEFSVRYVLNILRDEFNKRYRVVPNNHEQFIPIGQDVHGTLICLSLGIEDYGSVHFFDYETPKKLTQSFNDFLGSLVEYRDIW